MYENAVSFDSYYYYLTDSLVLINKIKKASYHIILCHQYVKKYNNNILNPIKSQCMVFKPNRFK